MVAAAKGIASLDCPRECDAESFYTQAAGYYLSRAKRAVLLFLITTHLDITWSGYSDFDLLAAAVDAVRIPGDIDTE